MGGGEPGDPGNGGWHWWGDSGGVLGVPWLLGKGGGGCLVSLWVALGCWGDTTRDPEHPLGDNRGVPATPQVSTGGSGGVTGASLCVSPPFIPPPPQAPQRPAPLQLLPRPAPGVPHPGVRAAGGALQGAAALPPPRRPPNCHGQGTPKSGTPFFFLGGAPQNCPARQGDPQVMGRGLGVNLDLEVAPPTQVLGVSQKWGAPPNSGVNPRAALDIGVPPQTMGVCPPPN